jgi:DNA-binding LytR/AlgR family response regulator
MHLKILEDLLPGNYFVRIHGSYIVAMRAITALQGNVVENGRQELPVGATYKDELLKRLCVG